MISSEKQVGQAFFPAAFIHDTQEGIAQIERYIRDFEIGGLTFFYSRESVETNFDRKTYTRQKDSVVQLARMIDRYQQLSKDPLLISIDAEWGLGMRIDSHPAFPYPLTLAASNSPELVFETGRAIAKELKSVGVHFNLAPVVDININPENPVIGYRSFGEDPHKVFELARAYYEGMKSEGLLGCVKHFPGHGDTHVDSHLGLPVIDKSRSELDATELYPFRKFIEQGVDCVMVGHMIVPALDPENPTSLSAACIEDVLRKDLGFSGAVMTDALNMRSVFSDVAAGEIPYRAFTAGNDVLSFTPDLEEGFDRIVKQVDRNKIEASYQKVQGLKYKVGLSERTTDPNFDVPDSHDLRLKLGRGVVTVLKPIERTIREDELLISFFQCPETFQGFSRQETVVREGALYGLLERVEREEYLWMLVVPPSQKPGNQFGMDQPFLDTINKLIKHKRVHLAWIGNPYGLSNIHWRDCSSIVVSQQALPELELAVLEYWESRIQPQGKPILSLLN